MSCLGRGLATEPNAAQFAHAWMMPPWSPGSPWLLTTDLACPSDGDALTRPLTRAQKICRAGAARGDDSCAPVATRVAGNLRSARTC